MKATKQLLEHPGYRPCYGMWFEERWLGGANFHMVIPDYSFEISEPIKKALKPSNWDNHCTAVSKWTDGEFKFSHWQTAYLRLVDFSEYWEHVEYNITLLHMQILQKARVLIAAEKITLFTLNWYDSSLEPGYHVLLSLKDAKIQDQIFKAKESKLNALAEVMLKLLEY